MVKLPYGYKAHTKQRSRSGQLQTYAVTKHMQTLRVTKGHDNEGSHLNSVTQVSGAILAIKVDGGIRFIVRSHFWNLKRSGQSLYQALT